MSQSCAAAYSRIPAARWVFRLSQIGTDRRLELDVRTDNQVAVVAPGKGVVPLALVLAVAARPVDQPGALARLVAAHRGDRPAPPGAAQHSRHRVCPRRPQLRARGGVIENPASSSKTMYAPSAAAVIPPAATHPPHSVAWRAASAEGKSPQPWRHGRPVRS